MYVPFAIPIETVDKELLHAVYTVNLSREDAEKLKYRMTRKRKINLTLFVLGLTMLVVGLFLPLILYFSTTPAVTQALEKHFGTLIVFFLVGFVGIFVALFSMNKCFGVAGAYLKALGIAYPGLPLVTYKKDDTYYGIRGAYKPKDYATGKGNRALRDRLALGQEDEARARGLLNYAISGRGQSRALGVFSAVLGVIFLAAWAYSNAYTVSFLDGSADHIIPTALLAMGGLMVFSVVRWMVILRNNNAHIAAIKAGYPRFFGTEQDTP